MAKPDLQHALSDHILPAMATGCRESNVNYGCTISAPAVELFKRRYSASLQKRLDEIDDSGWDRDRPFVVAAAASHGALAAAIAGLSQEKKVDELMLTKAAHIVEIECRYFLAEQQGKRAGALDIRGQYCW